MSEQKPDQWQKRHPVRTMGKWENTHEHDAKWWRDNSSGWEIRALYAAPPAQPAQAQPALLSDELILDIADQFGAFQYGDAQGDKRIAFAREIEAAIAAAKATK